MSYALWKLAHIVSASILFGTGLGIAFYCWFGYRAAMRSGEIAALRATLRLTVIADAAFTAPAVLFQAASGAVLMHRLGFSFASPWSKAVWALFIFTGACWLPVVWLQLRQWREANDAVSTADLGETFHRRFRLWFALGVPAFAAVLAIFWLMVARPLAVG